MLWPLSWWCAVVVAAAYLSNIKCPTSLTQSPLSDITLSGSPGELAQLKTSPTIWEEQIHTVCRMQHITEEYRAITAIIAMLSEEDLWYRKMQIWYSTLPMLSLLSSKAQGWKDFRKPSEPCHAGIHWIALAEYWCRYIPMCQGFSHFPVSLHHFALVKLATSSIWVIASNLNKQVKCNAFFSPLIEQAPDFLNTQSQIGSLDHFSLNYPP